MAKEKFDNISDWEKSLINGNNRDIDFVSDDSKDKVKEVLWISNIWETVDELWEQINSSLFKSISSEIKYEDWDKTKINEDFLIANKLFIWEIEWKWFVILNDKLEILSPEWVYFKDIIRFGNLLRWEIGDSYSIIFNKSWKQLTSIIWEQIHIIESTVLYTRIDNSKDNLPSNWSYLIDAIEWRVILETDKNISIYEKKWESYFFTNTEVIRSNWEVVYKSILPIIKWFEEKSIRYSSLLKFMWHKIPYSKIGINVLWLKIPLNISKFDKKPLLKTF